MGELSYTVGGDSNLVSFKSAARVPITSLKAHFKPKQDLHGYSKPWPAGGGKNLYDVVHDTISNYTTINSSFEIVTNEYFALSGYVEVLPSTDYTLSAAMKNTEGSIIVCRYDENKEHIGERLRATYTANKTSLSFTTQANCKYIRFSGAKVSSNDSVHLLFDTFQLEKGSTATSYEPYENICPIEGWNSAKITRTGKNIAHVFKYSSTTLRKRTNAGNIANSYGTTLSTLSYTLPDTPLIITQTPPDKDYESTAIYGNGYFCVGLDNVIFGKRYDISFKITNILSNPLNKTLNRLYIAVPSGARSNASQIIGDTLLFKNILFIQNNNIPEEYDLTIYNNGMSFTLSEFMVTEANTNDGVFEPYCGEVIPVTFPITGKNKFNISQITPQYVIINNEYITNTDVDTREFFQLYVEAWSDTSRVKNFITENITSTGTYSRSFTVTSDCTEMTRISIKHNGAAKDFAIKQSLKLIVGQTYTISMDVTGVDPTTIGGLSFGKIQIELGNTATSYEPYSANTTLYGGYIDLATGALMQTWGSLDLGSLNWYTQTSENAEWLRATLPIDVWKNTWYPNVTSSLNNHPPHFFVDRFKIVAGSAIYYGTAGDNVLGMDWRSIIRIKCDLYKQDASAFKTAMNGVILYYEYLTPVQVATISPINCKALLGQNNILSNTNDITEASYALHDTAPIRAAKHRIAANEPHIETIESSIAHFETDMVASLKECKVHFAPKQDTNGYGKVWIGGSGKNLLSLAPEKKIGNTPFMNNTTETATGFDIAASGVDGGYLVQVTPNTTYTYSYISTYNGNSMHGRVYELTSENDWNNYHLIVNKTSWTGSATFTTGENTNLIAVGTYAYGAAQNASITNMQLELGSTATSYEPYENICPIEGTTDIELYKTGKSLFGFNGHPFTVGVDYYNGNAGWFNNTDSSKIPHVPITYSVDLDMTNCESPYVSNNMTWVMTNKNLYRYLSGNSIASGQSGKSIAHMTITDSDDWAAFGLSIRKGGIASNPMVEIGNEATEYEPYNGETIPITFPLTAGKNKFNIDVEFANPDVTANTAASKRIFKPYTYCIGDSYSNYFSPEAVESYSIKNGVISVKRKSGYSVYGVSYAIPLVGGTTYHFSCIANSGYVHITYYDNEGNYLSGSYMNEYDFSFTVPTDSTISVFNFIAADTTNIATYSNIQIESGNTATSYEPYIAICGGYIDLKEGKLIQTHKCITLNGSESWDNYTASQQMHFCLYISDKKRGLKTSFSSAFPNVGNVYFWDRELYGQYGDHGNLKNIYVNAPYKMPGLVTEWKAYLAEHPMQLCYELETPIEYTLSPIQLKTLRGQNNIWSNSNGNISIQYYKRGR